MPSAHSPAALEAISVSKRYDGGVVALDRVDLRVAPGETVALIGESGSGKTTLLRLFNRMTVPTDGTVRVAGNDACQIDVFALRRRIGYVQQDGGLIPHWTVSRNVELVPRLLNWPRHRREEKIRQALHLVGLDPEEFHNRFPTELSGGQRQRVAFARALAAEPEILLLDEPFGALDALTRLEMQQQFRELKQDLSATLVLVTHDLEEAFLVGRPHRHPLWRPAPPDRHPAAAHRQPPARLRQRPSRLSRPPPLGQREARPMKCRARNLLPLASIALSSFCLPSVGWAGEAGSVVVGSKNFAENRLLAEIFAQLIEERTDLRVERRLGLAGTQVAFEALRTGAIDLYPEYTGTGLVSLLGEPPEGNATATLNRVRRKFLDRWDLWWIAPLGFENAYEIAVRQDLADELQLRTLSDLVAAAPRLKAGFGYEFKERPDGLPGLEEVYGLQFGDVQAFQQGLKYQAAGAGDIDVLDVYTTDGRLLVFDLAVLEDDRGFFPPYQAAVLARGEALRQHPRLGSVLGLLSDALDEDTMRSLNLRLQEHGEEEPAVARDALVALGLVASSVERDPKGAADRQGFIFYLWAQRAALTRRTLEHLGMSGLALLFAILVAVPAGLALERKRRFAEAAIRLVGITQTLPSIALLAFMIPLLGVGWLPAVTALWVYSLFPILRNTYTGVRDADPRAVQSAMALGMTPGQILWQIRLPLASAVILAGIRTAAVIVVGTATLAAFIGAGGLGEPIVTGLQLVNTQMILSGALPAATLAIAVDLTLAWVERRLQPRGLS